MSKEKIPFQKEAGLLWYEIEEVSMDDEHEDQGGGTDPRTGEPGFAFAHASTFKYVSPPTPKPEMHQITDAHELAAVKGSPEFIMWYNWREDGQDERGRPVPGARSRLKMSVGSRQRTVASKIWFQNRA